MFCFISIISRNIHIIHNTASFFLIHDNQLFNIDFQLQNNMIFTNAKSRCFCDRNPNGEKHHLEWGQFSGHIAHQWHTYGYIHALPFSGQYSRFFQNNFHSVVYHLIYYSDCRVHTFILFIFSNHFNNEFLYFRNLHNIY